MQSVSDDDRFLKVWETIWEFQKDEDKNLSLDDTEIKKKLYLEASTKSLIVFGILGSFIVLTNLPVVISSGLILKKRSDMRSTYWLLGNISLADMITGFVLISKLASLLYPEFETQAIQCDIRIAVGVAGVANSLYSVAFIAIDRYLFITHGLQYNQWVKPMRLRLIILASWIHGIFLGCLPVIFWSKNPQAGGRVCTLITTVNPNYLIIVAISAAIPILTSFTFQGMILYYAIKNVIRLRAATKKLPKHNRSDRLRIFKGTVSAPRRHSDQRCIDIEVDVQRCSESEGSQNQRTSNVSRLKAIKVVFFTTGAMMLTMTPFFVACLLYATCDPIHNQDECKRQKYIAGIPLYLLMFSNSFLNPIIYAWWHRGFRESLKTIYRTKVKQSQLIKQLEISIMERHNRSVQMKAIRQAEFNSNEIIVTHL